MAHISNLMKCEFLASFFVSFSHIDWKTDTVICQIALTVQLFFGFNVSFFIFHPFLALALAILILDSIRNTLKNISTTFDFYCQFGYVDLTDLIIHVLGT